MPDAPPPVRNGLGDIVGAWSVRVDYDEVLDVIVVNVRLPGGRWRKSTTTRGTFGPDEIEDAIAAVQVAIRTAGARRLF